jgi:hypothetical protein
MFGSKLSRTLRFAGVSVAVTALVAVATSAPAGAAQPPRLDHFLCYISSAQGFKPPASALLKNQFSKKGFRVKFGDGLLHCNPVAKTLQTGQTTPIKNPKAHLVCFQVTPGSPQPIHVVDATNQFGTARLTTGDPVALCLPTWKNEQTPKFPKAAQPPGLDHFTCYNARYLNPDKPFKLPSSVGLADQFGKSTATLGEPNALCLPTSKTVPGKPATKITNPQAHLVCFTVKLDPPPLGRTVFDKNQFGIAKVATQDANELCVPSFKKVIR